MGGTYNLECRRTVSSANLNVYKSPTVHPDRVMPQHDLVYIIEGSWEIVQNGTLYRVLKDDVILLHGNEHHYGTIPCESGTSTFYLHMSVDDTDRYYPEDGGQSSKIETVTHCRSIPSVKTLFQNIVHVYLSDSQTKKEKLSALCQLLLCQLQESGGSTAQLTDSAVDRVIDLIYSNPQKILSSKELAGAAFTSERTLRNKFLEYYQMTPYQYQFRLKLKNICMTLTDFPDMKLHEIANNYGFYDEFHLSKAFKKVYGISPKAYRDEHYTGYVSRAE